MCIVSERVSIWLVCVVSCNTATVIFCCEAVPKTLTLSLRDCFARFVLEMPCSSKKVSFIVEFEKKMLAMHFMAHSDAVS